jgi:hypothetical protein
MPRFKKGDRIVISGDVREVRIPEQVTDRPQVLIGYFLARDAYREQWFDEEQLELWIPPEPTAEIQIAIDRMGKFWTRNKVMWSPIGDPEEALAWPFFWRLHGPARLFTEVPVE